MNLFKFTFLAMASAALLAACGNKPVPAPATPPAASTEPQYPTNAQPKLQTVKLYIGAKEVEAEVAIEMEQLQTGLMFRKEMPEDSGMLFVFPVAHQASFWMKNCSLPLSIAYINPSSTIAELHDMEPFNTNSIKAASANIQFALEMNQGWYKKNGIEPGASIRTPKGTLLETFQTGR